MDESIDVDRASGELDRLIEVVQGGGQVMLTHAGLPVARLVPMRVARRIPGRLRGRSWIGDDFDAPVDEMTRSIDEVDPHAP